MNVNVFWKKQNKELQLQKVKVFIIQKHELLLNVLKNLPYETHGLLPAALIFFILFN